MSALCVKTQKRLCAMGQAAYQVMNESHSQSITTTQLEKSEASFVVIATVQ